MKNKQYIWKYIALAGLALSGLQAHAEDTNLMANGTLTSIVQVQEICELEASKVDFGVIDFIATKGSVSKRGYLSVRCTKGVNYTIKMSREGVAEDGFRKLKNVADNKQTVDYNLYVEDTSQLFGDGYFGQHITGAGTGLKQSVAYEARILFDQTVAPGYYEDIVSVVIDY